MASQYWWVCVYVCMCVVCTEVFQVGCLCCTCAVIMNLSSEFEFYKEYISYSYLLHMQYVLADSFFNTFNMCLAWSKIICLQWHFVVLFNRGWIAMVLFSGLVIDCYQLPPTIVYVLWTNMWLDLWEPHMLTQFSEFHFITFSLSRWSKKWFTEVSAREAKIIWSYSPTKW